MDTGPVYNPFVPKGAFCETISICVQIGELTLYVNKVNMEVQGWSI